MKNLIKHQIMYVYITAAGMPIVGFILGLSVGLGSYWVVHLISLISVAASFTQCVRMLCSSINDLLFAERCLDRTSYHPGVLAMSYRYSASRHEDTLPNSAAVHTVSEQTDRLMETHTAEDGEGRKKLIPHPKIAVVIHKVVHSRDKSCIGRSHLREVCSRQRCLSGLLYRKKGNADRQKRNDQGKNRQDVVEIHTGFSS